MFKFFLASFPLLDKAKGSIRELRDCLKRMLKFYFLVSFCVILKSRIYWHCSHVEIDHRILSYKISFVQLPNYKILFYLEGVALAGLRTTLKRK